MKKKWIALVMSVILCVVTLAPAAGFASRDTSYEEVLAGQLKQLGLFQGVSNTDFDLNRAPTRVEALVMLIRVLGKESEALGASWRHPFTDVPGWADRYVGYAYQKGLTNGISATEFGTGNADAKMYLTFMLRALMYSDENGQDFLWNNPYALAEHVGILPGRVDRENFWRADVVLVSYAALAAGLKDSTQTLAQKLIADGVLTYQQYSEYYNVDALPHETSTGKSEFTAEEIYQKCAPAVFYIEKSNSLGMVTATGSGFFIESSGVAVTNYHVIDGADSATATLPDSDKQYRITGVYAYDKESDWAVIQVEGNGFSYLTPGEESSIVGGATVYAIGSPLGLQNTISNGIISNVDRYLDGIHYIQTTAAISHGSSGGALINKNGGVIGITSAGFTEGENLGLAIPISSILGYQKNTLTPLSVLFGTSNHHTQENLPTATTGSRQADAWALLYAFTKAFANDTLSDEPVYTEAEDTANGYLEYTLSMEEDGIEAIHWEVYDNQPYYTSIYLTPAGNTYFVFYSYNVGEDYTYTGSGTINAATFSENSSFRFSDVEGTADRATNEAICQEDLVDLLWFVDSVFEYLSENGFGDYSIRDFGFISL